MESVRPPAICIDGRDLALTRGTGIATYGRNLLGALTAMRAPGQVLYGTMARRAGTDGENQALIALNSENDRVMDRRLYYLRTAASPLGRWARPLSPSPTEIWPEGRRPEARRYWWAPSLFRFSHRAFRKYSADTPVRFTGPQSDRPDVMHWTSPMPVHAPGMPNLYTFHDLIPLTHPELAGNDADATLRLYRKVADRADHIAVVSETTRRDLVEHLGIAEDRITNTYQTVVLPDVSSGMGSSDLEQQLRDTFGLRWKGYFLHYGAIEPKKNLGRLVEAYITSGVMSPLILVGNPAWMSDEETALLDKIRREGWAVAARIRQYDYMPFELLQLLIRGAKATLFPSLYEGFGLPVLESMLSGSAVLTSTAGSLPEIAGGAALLVSPTDLGAIAKGIVTLEHDDDVRAELVMRGRIRSADFSAAAYERRLKTLYGKLGVELPV
ncbi:N/A [soil metagenome]